MRLRYSLQTSQLSRHAECPRPRPGTDIKRLSSFTFHLDSRASKHADRGAVFTYYTYRLQLENRTVSVPLCRCRARRLNCELQHSYTASAWSALHLQYQ